MGLITSETPESLTSTSLGGPISSEESLRQTLNLSAVGGLELTKNEVVKIDVSALKTEGNDKALAAMIQAKGASLTSKDIILAIGTEGFNTLQKVCESRGGKLPESGSVLPALMQVVGQDVTKDGKRLYELLPEGIKSTLLQVGVAASVVASLSEAGSPKKLNDLATNLGLNIRVDVGDQASGSHAQITVKPVITDQGVRVGLTANGVHSWSEANGSVQHKLAGEINLNSDKVMANASLSSAYALGNGNNANIQLKLGLGNGTVTSNFLVGVNNSNSSLGLEVTNISGTINETKAAAKIGLSF